MTTIRIGRCVSSDTAGKEPRFTLWTSSRFSRAAALAPTSPLDAERSTAFVSIQALVLPDRMSPSVFSRRVQPAGFRMLPSTTMSAVLRTVAPDRWIFWTSTIVPPGPGVRLCHTSNLIEVFDAAPAFDWTWTSGTSVPR